jgi:hypothetical protein
MTTADPHTDGSSWVVGGRQWGQGSQTLYVWAPAQQIERVERQLGVELRLGLMEVADLHRVMKAWSAHFGATDRKQAHWEEFAGGARVEIAIVMEPSPRQPTPLLLHGADSIAALAAAIPAGRQVPVLFARAVQTAIRSATSSAPSGVQGLATSATPGSSSLEERLGANSAPDSRR